MIRPAASRPCSVVAYSQPRVRLVGVRACSYHDELMKTGGLYSHLYTSAHASFDDQVVAVTGDSEFATRT